MHVLPEEAAAASLRSPNRELPSEGSSHTINPHDDPWAQKYLLTLDGGGIRGYSTLLIIKELMRHISILEQRHEDPADSSYHPLEFVPNKGSQVTNNALQSPSVRYLPVHYFDYMAGTSTGGYILLFHQLGNRLTASSLIAIMLSRLRMNVDDCLLEYRDMGRRVFRKPRIFSIRGPIPFPRDRYSEKKLRAVVEDVIKRRTTIPHSNIENHMFKSSEDRCRTILFSVNKDTHGVRGVYLFRSYQHLKSADGNEIELNPGPAHNIPTWEVARATTAAPGYFKEMKIGNTTHLDGGFGSANNPAFFAWWEVSQMSGDNENAIALTISIGTGLRKPVTPFSDGAFIGKWRAMFRFAAHIASDSEETHRMMVLQHKPAARSGRYHRFNVDQGLEDIKLGEWKTRSTPQGTEYVTLNQMEAATNAYLQKPDVQDRLRHFAAVLVNNRRARSRDQRWSNVATGQQYHCTIEGCIHQHTCHGADEDLRRHLTSLHNFSVEDTEALERIIQRGKILASE